MATGSPLLADSAAPISIVPIGTPRLLLLCCISPISESACRSKAADGLDWPASRSKAAHTVGGALPSCSWAAAVARSGVVDESNFLKHNEPVTLENIPVQMSP